MPTLQGRIAGAPFRSVRHTELKIIETMFSKMARSMLRGIRVASKQELIDRIHLYFMDQCGPRDLSLEV